MTLMNACQIPELVSTWVAAINNGQAAELMQYMSPEHTFYVDGEAPTVGQADNLKGWEGYFAAFPEYRIFIDAVYEHADTYYLLGHTHGSHVPPELESVPESVIWKVVLDADTISKWIIFDGSKRAELGIPNS